MRKESIETNMIRNGSTGKNINLGLGIVKFHPTATRIFILLSLLTIYMHYMGQDSHGIMLIHTNIILSMLSRSEIASAFINSGPIIECGSLAGEISAYWYVAHMASFFIYGAIIDGVRKLFNR